MSELKSSQWVEYPDVLGRYSNSDQLQAQQYTDILKTEKGQHFFKTEFDSLDEFAKGPGNPNLPKYNSQFKVKVKNDDGEVVEVDAYKNFWQFKQDAGRNFTSYKSAGLSNIDTDVSIAQMPLEGTTKSDPALVLSNNNYVRQNLQRYGKEYLTTTNMLNSIAWNNGMFSHATSVSPIRENINDNFENMMHQNHENVTSGDQFARPNHPLRVDLPSNLVNISYDSTQYINVSFIQPNKNTNMIFSDRLKTGILDLDSMKNVGRSCLTKEFNFTPLNSVNQTPVEVFNDNNVFDPIKNTSNNLYCSVNTNFVTMPRNYSPTMTGLDTSFVVNPGMNSVSLGTVMSPNLQSLINYQLYDLNKAQILRAVNNQTKSPNEEYQNLLSNQRKLLNSFNDALQELNLFIKNLSIFKFGPGQIKCTEISDSLITLDQEVFLLLPNMLSENVFAVRQNIPSEFATKDDINVHSGECLNKDASSFENAMNCGFRGTSGQWIQKSNPNFIPNVFNNPADYNNDLNNLSNSACGVNPYMAACSF